ncbi:ABLM3 protein, partial [Polyodon spathula]|nr:ABLM3 protein [Polyodon spathula]
MMFTEGEEMYLTGSAVWHPQCKQAARAERKLKHRRTSETSISPPGSSIGSPNRVICSLGTLSPYSQDIYDSIDLRQRRSSSPGYIDSLSYSRQGMSPTVPRSPQHYYPSGTESGRSSPYYSQADVRSATPTTYQAPKHFHVPDNHHFAGTKSKTSEDIFQYSKFPAAYSPHHYQQSESDYYHYSGSPKAPAARRFSSGGEEDGWEHSLHRIQSSIGRMILKEEMKARSGSYDNDPWASARNSRSGSKETLQSIGYEPMNGCKELCH